MDRESLAQVVRFGVNGLLATAVHFGVLTFNLKVLEMPSAGLANLLAAVAGIAASFIGSRYFVFRQRTELWITQAARFVVLYAAIACLHGLVLYVWTDRAGWDYRAGFLVATVLQTLCSFVGGKLLVFRK
jgi:putative flippase GtrA